MKLIVHSFRPLADVKAFLRGALFVASTFVASTFFAVLATAAEFEFENGDPWLAEEDTFLKVDEAFALTADLNSDGAFVARWEMPDGYYLYRHQFAFETKDDSRLTLGEPRIPDGKRKVDDFFGEVEVYYHSAEIVVPLESQPGVNTQIGVNYQGCADAGLCYPPETRWFAYDGMRLISASLAGDNGSVAASVNTASGQLASQPDAQSTSTATLTAGVADTEEQLLAGVLASENLWYALALFFIAGIGLAFTPCVLPMVPILSSIIVGEGDDISKRKAFTLSFAYVLGMAATYALVGTLVGLFGAELNLQAALQSPGVLIFFALVFVLLSLSMFGFYELQLPQGLQNRLNAMGQNQQGGKHASVMVMGALSSLVVSPCVSAPLAGALIYISTSNDAVLGGTALLALGLGMGVPLMVVGGSGGHWLPRAGAWMNGVKAVFGVGLLAVAVWLLERVVPPAVTLVLWAALLIGSGVYLGVLDFSPRKGFAQFGKAAGSLGFLWGVLLLIGAASGAHDPLKPLARLAAAGGAGAGTAVHAEPQWQAVKSLADVQAQIAVSSKPVILDLYADWCISCKVMERNVFPQPAVATRLNQFTLLRADVTDNDAIDRELLNHYGLFGPPSLVFFEGEGGELTDVRIQGEVNAETLAAHLGAVLASLNAGGVTNVGEIAAISR
ncbi:MAG: protein-disulfide reductase DsbD [bacterium]